MTKQKLTPEELKAKRQQSLAKARDARKEKQQAPKPEIIAPSKEEVEKLGNVAGANELRARKLLDEIRTLFAGTACTVRTDGKGLYVSGGGLADHYYTLSQPDEVIMKQMRIYCNARPFKGKDKSMRDAAREAGIDDDD